MHEMPDDWQEKMAGLLREWDETWETTDLPLPAVSAKIGGKFTKWPHWVLSYRHPELHEIDAVRSKIDRCNAGKDGGL